MDGSDRKEREREKKKTIAFETQKLCVLFFFCSTCLVCMRICVQWCVHMLSLYRIKIHQKKLYV